MYYGKDDRLQQSKFQKNIRKIIDDSKRFNKKIDEFIRNTNRQQSLPPLRINKGDIRKMEEQERIKNAKRLRLKQDYEYLKAKKKYELDMHNIMEKIIEAKKKILL